MIREKFQVRSSVPLKGHRGCVNALALTNDANSGRFLVTAGDDYKLLVWDTYSPHYNKPCVQHTTEHDANILTLSINATNERVFSGGNGSKMFEHDLRTGKEAGSSDFPAWRIKCHPTNPHLTVVIEQNQCQGPTLIMTDLRGRTTTQFFEQDVWVEGRYSDEIRLEGLDINPVDTNLMAVGGNDFCSLIDLRQPENDIFSYRSPLEKLGITQSTDVCFHPQGRHFISCQQNYLPTLYSIFDMQPLAVFYGADYTNIPTVKSVSFAECDGETYVIAGSDKKEIFIWRVPQSLLSARQSYYNNGDDSLQGTFYEKSLRKNIAVIDKPVQVVSGAHRGNVNNVLYHPHLQRIYGSGVEKTIWQHNLQHLSAPPQSRDEDDVAEEDEHLLAYFDFMNATSLPPNMAQGGDQLQRLMHMALESLQFSSRNRAARQQEIATQFDDEEDYDTDFDDELDEEEYNEEDDENYYDDDHHGEAEYYDNGDEWEDHDDEEDQVEA